MAVIALFSVCGGSALAEEGIEELDRESTHHAYQVVVDMACLDRDYRRYLGVSDVDCEGMARERLVECRNQLQPILPEFGIRAHMQGDETHPERVKSASIALVYCIQARASFQPLSGDNVASGSDESEDVHSHSHSLSRIDELRSTVAQLPQDVVETLFRLSINSEYTMVWAAYGSQDVQAVVDNSGEWTSTEIEDQAVWSANMAKVGVRKVHVHKGHVILVLDQSLDLPGGPVLVKLSNREMPQLPVCTVDILVKREQDGACRIEGTKFADVFVSWLAEDGVSTED
jgi:hypothetical protein